MNNKIHRPLLTRPTDVLECISSPAVSKGEDTPTLPSHPNRLLVNRNIKDSVFRNLFSDKRYLLQLYQSLHPEDVHTTADDLKYVTLENVLVRGIYNDLGFCVGDRLLLMIEAQSSVWSENIIVRCLLYAARTLQDYITESTQSLFSERNVQLPEIELYVIYTGDSKVERDYITLSDSFFRGKRTAIDVSVKVITNGKKGDIISQYVIFTKIVNEQVREHGRTREAITEAIRICKNQDVMKEYLSGREKEVTDIMITLYDQEQVWKDYIASDRREQAEIKDQQTAQSLYEQNVSVNIIANSLGRSVRSVEKWLGLTSQSY